MEVLSSFSGMRKLKSGFLTESVTLILVLIAYDNTAGVKNDFQ